MLPGRQCEAFTGYVRAQKLPCLSRFTHEAATSADGDKQGEAGRRGARPNWALNADVKIAPSEIEYEVDGLRLHSRCYDIWKSARPGRLIKRRGPNCTSSPRLRGLLHDP